MGIWTLGKKSSLTLKDVCGRGGPDLLSDVETSFIFYKKIKCCKMFFFIFLSLVFLLISDPTSWLRLHQFLGTYLTQ